MRVIVRESAYRDLDNIHAWIAKDRPSVADRVIERIIQSTELLGHFPMLGMPARHEALWNEWFVVCLTSSIRSTVKPTN
jgi:plasmid stabilization system protein ParE